MKFTLNWSVDGVPDNAAFLTWDEAHEELKSRLMAAKEGPSGVVYEWSMMKCRGRFEA